MAIDRILVPHDLGETSAAAAAYAVALARTFGADLHFLHVGDAVPMNTALGFPLGLEGTSEAGDECLRAVVTPAEQAVLAPRFIVRQGQPAAEIVAYASQAQCDLIVMGTHGRGGIEHVVMGSVAEKVVRTASCPVLTVRTRPQPYAVPVTVSEPAGATA